MATELRAGAICSESVLTLRSQYRSDSKGFSDCVNPSLDFRYPLGVRLQHFNAVTLDDYCFEGAESRHLSAFGEFVAAMSAAFCLYV